MHWSAALGLLLLAACGGRRGPADLEGLVTPLTVEPPPIYAIIGARTDLALTSEQVAALDSIAMTVQVTNRPLIEELQAISPRARRGGAWRVTDEGEPILEEIRANGREAGEGVHTLLTEDQRSKVCVLFERTTSRGRQGPGAPPPDSAALNRPGAAPRWYWCGPSGPGGEPGEPETRQQASGS